MILGVLVIRVMELLFFAGLAGSAVVVLISFFEDGKELFGGDEDVSHHSAGTARGIPQ